MGRNLKQESYQFFHRWGAIILVLATLIGNYWLDAKLPIGAEKWDWSIDARCIELTTKGQMAAQTDFRKRRSESQPGKYPFAEYLAEYVHIYGLDDYGITAYEEVFPLIAKAQYARTQWFCGGLLFLCILFPPVLIRYPLSTGVPKLAARLCGSRKQVARAKLTFCYALAFLICLFTWLFQLLVYAGAIVSQAGFAYVLATLLLRILTDLAVLSIPFYLAFRISNPFAVLGFNTAYGFLCYAVNVAAHYLDNVVFIPFPAFLHGLRALWQPGASALWRILAALVSLAWILIFGWLSVRWFEKAGGKQPYDLNK